MNVRSVCLVFIVWVGGINAKEDVEVHPEVSVRYHSVHITNAVIIHPKWGITVAHAFQRFDDAELTATTLNFGESSEEEKPHKKGNRKQDHADEQEDDDEEEEEIIEKVIIKKKSKDKKKKLADSEESNESESQEDSKRYKKNQIKHKPKDSSYSTDYTDLVRPKRRSRSRRMKREAYNPNPFSIQFKFDVNNNEIYGQQILITQIIRHPQFQKADYGEEGAFSYRNDVALIQLEKKSNLSTFPLIFRLNYVSEFFNLTFFQWLNGYKREVTVRRFNEFDTRWEDKISVKPLPHFTNQASGSVYYNNITLIGLFSYVGDLTDKCYFSNLDTFEEWMNSIMKT